MGRRIEQFLLALAPAEMREWIAAMLREAEASDERERMRWYLGAAAVALRLRIGTALQLHAVALATIMLAVDWTWGALAPALLLIAVAAMVLTRNSKRKRVSAFFVAGGTLPLAHAIANWVPTLRPHYQYAALDLSDWLVLATVAGIGLCAVQVATLWRLWHQPTELKL